jgi:hypothetical protein
MHTQPVEATTMLEQMVCPSTMTAVQLEQAWGGEEGGMMMGDSRKYAHPPVWQT